MKNKFLITGATGFIGSNLVRELVRKKQDVNIIVRDKKLNWKLSDIAHSISIYECDITSTKLQEIVGKIRPDYIFHLASYGNLPHEDDIYKMIDVNFKGTANLLDAVKKNPFKLFVNTGSGAEYGIKKLPMKETDTLEPINNYGVIKSAISLYCQKETIRNNLPLISFRLFTPYGYFEGGNRLIPDVSLSVLDGKPIKVSSPTHVRDFVFIEDVVDAYMRAIDIKHKNGEIYNIGSGVQYSVGDIVRMIRTITKTKSPVEWGAVKKQARYIEPETWVADMTKTKRVFHWRPQTTIEVGLKKTIDWFKKNRSSYSA